ncbi:MAG: S9 family peptidase [Chloroflexi bacterium]|nr:MAG: S9 family peptidase [Chloroflexota bacterium]MBL1193306.1 S9 family peptidase [Chloroflexota bacterium]NOH10598.1 S9 family peptidase [Chloroflexota bacterium]
MTKQTAPYGSWKSPITSDLIASASIKLNEICFDGEDIYWTERRPSEAGRYVIVKRSPDGKMEDINPAPFNARTRVHEYGGGAFTVVDGVVYFSNFSDQRLYRQLPGEEPVAVTPEAALRYADYHYDTHRQRMLCILEDHRQDGQEESNSLVALDLDSGEVTAVLASGNDFYASPRLSPDGKQLAWLTWNHPNMPWDGTELWLADVNEDGSISNGHQIAGAIDETVFQPEWSPDGTLYFISDRNGWGNFYRWVDGAVEAVLEIEAEFGYPQWVFGLSNYGFESSTSIFCTYTQNGFWGLGRINTKNGEFTKVEAPHTQISDLHVFGNKVVFEGGSPNTPTSIILRELQSGEETVLKRSTEIGLDAGYLSQPEPVAFPTANERTAYGLYYPPINPRYDGPQNEKPPLLVMSHGGPTSATVSSLRLGIQYWTSRGVAVLDVNYGGSTGYGRAYQLRLNGNWGVVDVEDCEYGARYLVARGDVDGERLAITGGSAGGYTTLAALTFGDTFHVGASHYGVSDLEALALHTHKFESRYLDSMIGPYPEEKELYKQRSPIHNAHKLSKPVIFFQGLEDKIVPPEQSESMAEAVKFKELPVAYLPFEGEQHGFRQAENIKRALEAELYFYSRIFGFPLADDIEPVHIENLYEEDTP